MAVVDVVKKSYVNSQDRKYGVVVVVDNADRVAQFPAPLLNQRVHNLATGDIERWNGAIWVTDFQGTGGVKVSWPSKAFGITGDSATNDYGAFNTLVNVTMQPNGGRVILTGIVRIGNDLTIPRNVTIDYSEGARLAPDAAVTITHNGSIKANKTQIFATTGRIKFTNNYTLKHLYPEWWGAVADAVYADWTNGVITGTDSTIPIQLSWDAVTLGGAKCDVRMDGGYKTSDTLHLGYGNASFNSGFVNGAGYQYRGQGQFSGTAILCTKTDRPGVNFQGARGSRIDGVYIGGLLQKWIVAQMLTQAGSLSNDLLGASWDDPSIGGALLDGRYSVYAGVTVDAYSGPQPGVHYPAVTYPWYLGVVAQYNKAFSSDVKVTNSMVGGFTAAFANQPCDADGNGDFTSLHKVAIEYCKYGFSVGNTQSRNVDLDTVKMLVTFCGLTNNKHGMQQGKFGGTIKDLSTAFLVNIFDFGGTSIAGPLSFINYYGEGLWMIGKSASPSSVEQSIAFRQSQFNFDMHIDARGHPAYLMELNGSGSCDVLFDGCMFNSYKSIAGFKGSNYRFDGCTSQPSAVRTNPYEKVAHNSTVGGFMFSQIGNINFQPRRFRCKTAFTYNVDSGASVAGSWTDRYFDTDRTRLIPFWVESVVAKNDPGFRTLGLPPRAATAQSKAGLASLTLIGSTLTITFAASRSAFLFNQYGPLPGDSVWDDQTGTVFWVRSRVGDVVLAEIQNNYKMVAGVATPLAAFSTAVGNLYFRNARIYTPPYFLRVDTLAANAVLSNAARDDGFAAWFDAEITAGDYLVIDEEADRFLNTPADSLIAARNQATPSITLSGASMRATEVRRQIKFISRIPVANV
jgi:hypothetical protein